MCRNIGNIGIERETETETDRQTDRQTDSFLSDVGLVI